MSAVFSSTIVFHADIEQEMIVLMPLLLLLTSVLVVLRKPGDRCVLIIPAFCLRSPDHPFPRKPSINIISP